MQQRLPQNLSKVYTSSELRRKIGENRDLDGESDVDLINRYLFVVAQRQSMSMSSLPIALLGAFLGWRLRRSGFMEGLAVAFISLLLFYYPVHFLGESLSRLRLLDPVLSAWLPTLTISFFVGVLFYWNRK